MHGLNVPGWLIGQGGDVTSIAVLALLEYDQAIGGSDAATRTCWTSSAKALADYQHGDDLNYPWAHAPRQRRRARSWHAWGSTQTFALARAGKQLGQADWIASARREADTFYARLLAGPMVCEWGVLPFSYPQIAYGMNSMTQGLLALIRRQGTTNTLAWPAWRRAGSTAITAQASPCTTRPPGAAMTA